MWIFDGVLDAAAFVALFFLVRFFCEKVWDKGLMTSGIILALALLAYSFYPHGWTIMHSDDVPWAVDGTNTIDDLWSLIKLKFYAGLLGIAAGAILWTKTVRDW
ncbi:hypothetical protein JOS77_14075 [Chromobacterium haemolyticum]|nr:hypothetical protein JOS77_14075 [Chromobacterium haemolyticum]